MNIRPSGHELLGLKTATSQAEMLANMRVNVQRALPTIDKALKPNAHTLSVAGGGPSLADTHRLLGDVVATMNGSLGFLLGHPEVRREGRHFLCGVCDAGEHIADMVAANTWVRYYIASLCNPRLIDKLTSAGCDVTLWHVSPSTLQDNADELKDILDGAYDNWIAIGGGSTMGLRWIDLGFVLGFRAFDLHGLDSSFRDGHTHAYPDRADERNHMEFKGRMTRPNFIAQVHDFFDVMDRFALTAPETKFRVLGDGLLQDECKPYVAARDGQFFQYRFPEGDREGPMIVVGCRQLLEAILPKMPEGRRRVAVQAGGNVGVMAKMLAEHFDHVFTYEPDEANVRCMIDNLPETNVTMIMSALGAEQKLVTLQRQTINCGQTRIDASQGWGDTQMVTIDGHPGLGDVDLLVLDVEGFELEVLKGATRTIDRCRPIIVVEENGLSEDYGIKTGACLDWLADYHGYGVIGIDGHNYILAPQD